LLGRETAGNGVNEPGDYRARGEQIGRLGRVIAELLPEQVRQHEIGGDQFGECRGNVGERGTDARDGIGPPCHHGGHHRIGLRRDQFGQLVSKFGLSRVQQIQRGFGAFKDFVALRDFGPSACQRVRRHGNVIHKGAGGIGLGLLDKIGLPFGSIASFGLNAMPLARDFGQGRVQLGVFRHDRFQVHGVSLSRKWWEWW